MSYGYDTWYGIPQVTVNYFNYNSWTTPDKLLNNDKQRSMCTISHVPAYMFLINLKLHYNQMWLSKMWLAHLTVLYIFGTVSLSHGTIVDTEYGQVSGHFVNVDNGRDPVMPIEVFHGIPYAKDTSGPLRFAVSIQKAV